MVYLFDEMGSLTWQVYQKLCTGLSKQRLNRVRSYKFMQDKKMSAAVYLLLRYGLQKEYGIKEKVRFCYGALGKPVLQDYPEICFNMSHCRKGIICGISNESIGVDVETAADACEDLWESVLTPQEISIIKECDYSTHMFSRFWTQKESYVKYLGTGLMIDMKQLDFSMYMTGEEFDIGGNTFLRTIENQNYCFSYCSDIKECLNKISIDELLQIEERYCYA